MTYNKVIKIIDDSKVLINIGYSDNITKDDVFEIFLIGEEVVDPDSKLLLGTLDVIKAIVIPTIIYDKMCICVNAETELTNTPFSEIGKAISNIYGMTTTNKRLDVDSTQITGGLQLPDKIRIGDNVRKIHKDA